MVDRFCVKCHTLQHVLTSLHLKASTNDVRIIFIFFFSFLLAKFQCEKRNVPIMLHYTVALALRFFPRRYLRHSVNRLRARSNHHWRTHAMNDDDDYYQGASWQRQLQWQRAGKNPQHIVVSTYGTHSACVAITHLHSIYIVSCCCALWNSNSNSKNRNDWGQKKAKHRNSMFTQTLHGI